MRSNGPTNSRAGHSKAGLLAGGSPKLTKLSKGYVVLKKTQAPNHEVIRLHDGAIKQRWDLTMDSNDGVFNTI